MCEKAIEWAQVAPFATPAIAFTAAVVAALIAFGQLRTAKRNEAKRQFVSYLDTVIAHHGFINKWQDDGHIFITKENRKEFNQQYFALLAKGLMSFEEILHIFSGDVNWKKTIIEHLYLHLRGLRHIKRHHYSPALVRLIDEVLDSKNKSKDSAKKGA